MKCYGVLPGERCCRRGGFMTAVLVAAIAFVAGVVGANHCPVIRHYSGGPCESRPCQCPGSCGCCRLCDDPRVPCDCECCGRCR